MASGQQVGGPCVRLNNGKDMPLMGFGTWRADPSVVVRSVENAIRVGYRHIDCAAMYENQKEVGQALRKMFDERVIQREDIFLTSKLWCTNFDPQHVRDACVDTLRKLGVEYLDCFLLHWPLALEFSGDVGKPTIPKDNQGVAKFAFVPLQDTWKAMEALVDEGLVRGIGISNFDVMMTRDVLSYCRIKPIVNQFETHVTFQRQGLVDYCKRNDIAVVAHTPLGGGSVNEEQFGTKPPMKDEKLNDLAKKAGLNIGQLLLRFNLDRKVAVIPKSSKEERIKQNFDTLNQRVPDNISKSIKDFDRGISGRTLIGEPIFGVEIFA